VTAIPALGERAAPTAVRVTSIPASASDPWPDQRQVVRRSGISRDRNSRGRTLSRSSDGLVRAVRVTGIPGTRSKERGAACRAKHLMRRGYGSPPSIRVTAIPVRPRVLRRGAESRLRGMSQGVLEVRSSRATTIPGQVAVANRFFQRAAGSRDRVSRVGPPSVGLSRQASRDRISGVTHCPGISFRAQAGRPRFRVTAIPTLRSFDAPVYLRDSHRRVHELGLEQRVPRWISQSTGMAKCVSRDRDSRRFEVPEHPSGRSRDRNSGVRPLLINELEEARTLWRPVPRRAGCPELRVTAIPAPVLDSTALSRALRDAWCSVRSMATDDSRDRDSRLWLCL